MSRTRQANREPRQSAWITKSHAEAVERLKVHPSIPFRAALDEVVEEGIKVVERKRRAAIKTPKTRRTAEAAA